MGELTTINLSPGRRWFMIAVLATAAYAPTLRLPFLWDDHVMIENNPHLPGWSYENLRHDFTTDVFDHHGDNYYRPLQTLANRADYSLWGLSPAGYHLTNLFFHISNSILIAELILAMGFSVMTAFVTGSLFAVHPMVVEQLMIIAGRAELMGLLFSLASISLLLKEGLILQFCGYLAFLAALFSKESALAMPALFALVLYYRKVPLEKYTRVLPLLLLTVPYLWLRHRSVGSILPSPDLWLMTRFFFQEFPRVVGNYLALLLLPWNLHSHRLLPHLSHFWGLYLALFSSLIYCFIKKYKSLGIFCIGWFIFTLLPKTPIMIFGNFMLDHWAYPAELAVLLPLAILITKGWQSHSRRFQSVAGCLYGGLLIGWSLLVHLNVAIRGTDEKMYRWALRFTTSNPIKYNLGVLLLETGRPEAAALYLEDYLIVYPDNVEAGNALALAYWKSGHPWLAAHILQGIARKHPSDLLTQKHLALIHAALPQRP